MSQVASRVAKNTGILYAKMGITVFTSLYATRLILNALGMADFGVFNIVGGAIAMLGFLDAAMATATQRFMSYAKGSGDMLKEKVIFNISVVLHFYIAITACALLLFVGYFFFNGILNISENRMYAAKIIYCCMVVATVFNVMGVPYEAVINANEDMLYFAIIGIIESILKLVVAFIIVYTSTDKLILYGILTAGISLVMMLIMRIYCHRKYPECILAPKKYHDKKVMKEMTSYAGWNLLGSCSGIIYGYGSNLLLNQFFGTVLNAANAISGQINGQLLVFSSNMLKAVNPVIVKAEGGGDRQQMFQATFMACKISVLIYAVFAVPFIVESATILKFWLKNVPPYTETFLQLMVLQVLFEQITAPLNTVIGAVGNIQRYNVINALILCISILFLYVAFLLGSPPEALRLMGISAAFLQMVYRIYYCSKYYSMHYLRFLKTVIAPTLSLTFIVLVFTMGIKLLLEESYLRVIIICLLSGTVFSSLFYLLILSADERNTVKKIVFKH